MNRLLADLGGKAVVCKAIGRTESTLRDWLSREAFSPMSYGKFLELGNAVRVHIPTDLFGVNAEKHWPEPVNRQSDPAPDVRIAS